MFYFNCEYSRVLHALIFCIFCTAQRDFALHCTVFLSIKPKATSDDPKPQRKHF